MERLKMHSLYLCKYRIGRYELPTYTMFHASPIGSQSKFEKIRGYQYPWYRVYTKPMFISKGSYGNGEA